MSREYHVTVRLAGGDTQGFRGNYPAEWDAIQAGLAVLDERAGTVSVRPDQQRTYSEGRARWPHALHPQCFMEAFLGWSERGEEAARCRAVAECAA